MPVLRRAHDHHRDLPTRDAAARATCLFSTDRDDDAVTGHGPRPNHAVALPLRQSSAHAPSGSPASFDMLFQENVIKITKGCSSICAQITLQKVSDVDPRQPRDHRKRTTQHKQIPKSP
jgi:hypothetical protein